LNKALPGTISPFFFGESLASFAGANLQPTTEIVVTGISKTG